MEPIEIQKHYISELLALQLIKQRVSVESDNNGYYINGWITGIRPEDEYFNPQRVYLCWWEKGDSNPVGVLVYYDQITF